MNFRYTAAALAALALGNAQADEGPSFKFSGFGTLSAVHSSEHQADFVGSSAQPSGAGYTRATSFDPDSKLGVQLDAKVGDKWSGVLQVVSQHQYDNTYTPQIEWANIKYQVTPELGVRLGRIAAPSFALSEARLVGYANPSVRPPQEVYGLNPITSNDGVDATYRSAIAGFNNTFQAFYGSTSIKLPSGMVKSRPAWGFNDTVESGALSLRFAYTTGTTSLDIPAINGLIDGLAQFAASAGAVPVPAFQSAAAQANAMYQKYRSDHFTTKVFAVGASYDPGNWFVSAEFATENFNRGVLADANAWYVTGGYRFASLTPYATYASAKAKSRTDPGISTAGAPPLAPAAAALTGGVNAVLGNFSQSQSSVAVGLRWDFMANVALKTQFDRLNLDANSAGRLGNVQPGFVPGGKVNLVSVAVDFVF